jgi:hypothetical protein
MAETPREFAHVRAKEVKRLLARLNAGHAMVPDDVASAIARASEAKRHAVEAHLKAAERHLGAAEMHERAAAMYEARAANRPGNEQARLRALDNKSAAERRRVAADVEVRRAMQASDGTS